MLTLTENIQIANFVEASREVIPGPYDFVLSAQQTQARDLVAALVKLYRDNAATLTPDPIYSVFYDSHPPAAARIAQLKAA